jgi:hypothetical protein
MLRGFRDCSQIHEQVLVMERKAVTMHYLRTWFALDLFASLPLDLILRGRRLDILRLPRLLKVVRIMHYNTFSQAGEPSGPPLTISPACPASPAACRGTGRERFRRFPGPGSSQHFWHCGFGTALEERASAYLSSGTASCMHPSSYLQGRWFWAVGAEQRASWCSA